MNGLQIKSSIESYVRSTLTPEETILIINEALDEIADQGLVFAAAEVNAQSDIWYEMPNDCTSIIDIEDNKQNPYYGWDVNGNQIRFRKAGTYTIYARKQPEHLVFITDEPAIHPLYHQAIVTYGRGWAKLKENDESMDGHKKMDEFQQKVMKAFNTLRRKRSPMQWKVIRHA